VRSDGVVVLSLLFDQRLGLLQRVEYLFVEQFIPELAVERLVVAVLSRAARSDEERLNINPDLSRESLGEWLQ
jgi:hypothetical protein